MKQNIRLFIDFDGTVTTRDVGDGIFSRFLRKDLVEQGWHERIIAEWKAGRLSSQVCLLQECENTVVTEDELREELEKYEITPGFVKTAEYCRKMGIPMMILSDGMDYYIKYLLNKYNLCYIPFRSNHMRFNGTSLIMEFPFMDKGCGRCGNCKRWHMDKARMDGECIVYVGDGYSDRYAIKSADVIFARHDLAEYCRKNDIKYMSFENFFVILDYLEFFHGES